VLFAASLEAERLTIRYVGLPSGEFREELARLVDLPALLQRLPSRAEERARLARRGAPG
jgi:hypothetical protein